MLIRSTTCGVLAMLALTGCEPVGSGPVTPLPPNSPEAHALMPVGSQWDILMLNGRRLDAGVASFGTAGPEAIPNVIGDNSAGFSACNQHTGLAFTPLGLPKDPGGQISTMAECDDALMALDEELLAAIPRTEAIGPGSQPGTVDLIAGGQRLMVVRRKPDDQ